MGVLGSRPSWRARAIASVRVATSSSTEPGQLLASDRSSVASSASAKPAAVLARWLVIQPTVPSFATTLGGVDAGDALATGGPALAGLREKVPTGALATLELDVERWHDLDHGMATATTLVTPRSLEARGGG